MERFNKFKLSIGAIRRYYATSILPKPPVFNSTPPLPLIRQPNSSISFPYLTRSCGFSSSPYLRQKFVQSGQVNEIFSFSVSENYFGFFGAIVSGIVLSCGYLYVFRVKEVPYTHRKRLLTREFGASVIGDYWLHWNEKFYYKGGILPSNDPRIVKVGSILKNLFDTLYKDLGLDEIPSVTYGGMVGSPPESNKKGIADMSFKQIRRKFSQWRTDMRHLKGRKWNFLVFDDPESDASAWGIGTVAVYTGLLDRHSDLEIAIVLAQQVGHCVARHCSECIVYNPDVDELMTKLLNRNRHFEPLQRRAIIEADYIALRLMASAGYDPHVVLQGYEKLKASTREDKRNYLITLQERIELLSHPHVMEEACAIYRKATDCK